MQIGKTRLIVITVICLLTAITIYMSVECFLLAFELKTTKSELKVQQNDEKVKFFAKLFIDKILLSEGVVSFDDRLKLENAVRDINDEEIMFQWEKFTENNGDAEAQKIVGIILDLLIKKIST